MRCWVELVGRKAERVPVSSPAGEANLPSVADKESVLDFQAEEEAPVVSEASGEDG